MTLWFNNKRLNFLSKKSIKLFFKKISYLFQFLIKLAQFFAKIIDLFVIPIAILYDRRGINVFEAKTRSFGHHLFEPIAVAVLNMSKNKRDQKKLILLANQEKAYVKYTNTLLKQKFQIIEKYSFLNIYYWLASKYCGLSRSTKYKEQLDIFLKRTLNMNNLDVFDHSHCRKIKKLMIYLKS